MLQDLSLNPRGTFNASTGATSDGRNVYTQWFQLGTNTVYSCGVAGSYVYPLTGVTYSFEVGDYIIIDGTSARNPFVKQLNLADSGSGTVLSIVSGNGGITATTVSNTTTIIDKVDVTKGLQINSSAGKQVKVDGQSISFNTSGQLYYSGGPVYVASNAYTLVATDNIVETSNPNLTIRLPDATQVPIGKPYYIKNQNTSNTLVSTFSGQTIDGQATWVIADPWNSFGFYSNGTNWRTL